MNTKNGEYLGTYNVKKLLINLSIPAILGMLVNALYNLVDTLFVGLGSGEIAIGAIAVAFPAHMIIIAFGLMIGVGGASIFSRAYGRGDEKTMSNVINTALRMDFFGALLIAIVGFIFLDQMLIFFGASDSNIGFAKDYLSIILLGLVPLSLSMVLNNFVRAEGRARIAMKSMMLGAGLNIILDPIFIFSEVDIFGLQLNFLGFGVKGAAMATVISQSVAFTYIFTKALSKDSALKINVKNWFDIHYKTVKDILTIGGPTFVRNSIWAFLAIININLINHYSSVDPAIYVSIYGVINRLILFIFLPGYGIVQGLNPIVGYNFGAKKFDRLNEVLLFATKLVVIYFFFGFLFVQFFAEGIFGVFSKSNNAFFITEGSKAFRLVSIGFIIVGFNIILGAVYQSLGYPVKAFLIAVSRQLLLFIPIVFILTPTFEIDGIWYTYAIADTLAGLIGLAMLTYEIKRFSSIIKQQKTSSI